MSEQVSFVVQPKNLPQIIFVLEGKIYHIKALAILIGTMLENFKNFPTVEKTGFEIFEFV